MICGQIYLISVIHSSLLCKMGWYPFWGIVINVNRLNSKECPLLEAHQLELQEEVGQSHWGSTSLPRALSWFSWLPGGSGCRQGHVTQLWPIRCRGKPAGNFWGRFPGLKREKPPMEVFSFYHYISNFGCSCERRRHDSHFATLRQESLK